MPDLSFLAQSSADHLRLMLNVGRMGAWELDLGSGRAWRNRRHDEIFGYRELLPEWTYEQFLAHVDPDHRERVNELQQFAIEHNEEWVFECPIIRADGKRGWISAAGAPLLDEDGNAFKLIGHVVDITETKATEDRLTLLTGELKHRVGNMLAMIEAIISLAARQADDVESFAESLTGRVSALARAQALIMEDTEEEITPADIVTRELEAYPEFRERVDFESQSDASLSASTAQKMALIIHELMTNAIKYGAFANDTGRVRFSSADEGDDLLVAIWAESGGPPVDEVARTGFGTRLITLALGADGTVELDFSLEGRTCKMRIHRR